MKSSRPVPESIVRRYTRISRSFGDAQYDPAAKLLRFTGFVRAWRGPECHMTRDSLYYARILLDGRDPAELEKACGIVSAVLATQVTREGSPVRGNFPWAAEDQEAEVWDPNWACFNAQTIIEILHWHEIRLPADLIAKLTEALRLCAAHDLERWVSPAYTNIALLTAACLGGTGERLRDDALLEAGRKKLREFEACVTPCNAFDEYDSPTYAAVNFRALATLALMIRDPEIRDTAERMTRKLWRMTLERLHPPTGQFSGPHGRAYGRDMLRHSHATLKYYLHREMPDEIRMGIESDGSASDLFPGLMILDPNCPDDLEESWRNGPKERTIVRLVDSCSRSGLPEVRRFPPFWRSRAGAEAWAELVSSKADPTAAGFTGTVQRTTTHIGARFCLGSVTAEGMGDQAAPILGHWPHAERLDAANYLSVSVLRERKGKLEYLPGGVLCSAQDGGRILGMMRFEADPEDRTWPDEAGVRLAVQVNADANPEVVAHATEKDGTPRLGGGAVIKAAGMLIGVRMIQVRVPGARIRATVEDRPAPHAHAEGELGLQLCLEPVKLAPGDEAFVAFALEMCDEGTEGGLGGLIARLGSARVSGDRNRDGWVRLVWGGRLSLETSTKVMDVKGWLTGDGEVRVTP